MMRVKGLTGPQADSVHRIRGLMAPQVAGRRSQAAVAGRRSQVAGRRRRSQVAGRRRRSQAALDSVAAARRQAQIDDIASGTPRLMEKAVARGS